MDVEDEPELTPEYLADWIGQIEDRVWCAERDAAISRFVLGNLVLELGRTGVIDAEGFIRKLLVAAPQHPDQPQAVQEFLEALLCYLPPSGDIGGSGGNGAPPVFH
ncbi:MAG: hypothetical protein COW48_10450 [Hydrogenophilales bacterium CG17_big_fil_post_rev_8_21_14_2_50_63_12]|nr:MAG: hypothetical protein COW48_10450 [Hydrogenophilales bacterium CG17_big_fil_post_rev_8_21_14_2_50_63_12]PIX97030.1 MAG: hypothetical protein COZ24_07305 [Hydrogenophilales bacterium CG_4_10_14_3_um_filter_63_21]PJB02334.1 MAG: hypothetical protein CO126_12285 [Hydrogenophilales bacterium CG_4_9_14_3_um_filter_63_34]